MVVENMSILSEQALCAAIDFVKEGIAVTDLDGIIINLNNGLLALFGYRDKSELIGAELICLVDTQEQSSAIDNLKHIYENNIKRNYQYTLIRADGSTFIGGFETRPVNDVNGKPSVYVTVISDYSERVNNQEDILIAEQNFRYSLDNSPMGIVIVSPDNELLYANKTILNIYGYDSVEELETTPPTIRFTPKSYVEFRERQKSRLSGKSIPHTYEVSIIRKDNEIRHLIAFRQPIIWNGEVCNQISYNDITEIKESEEVQRALAENSPVGVYIMQNGKFRYANTKFARLTGFSQEELMEMNPKEFLYPDDLEYVRENAVRMLKDDIVNSYEFRYINRRGEMRWALESVSSISYNGKRATLGTFMDITEHRRMVEELSYSDSALRSIHEGVYSMDNEFRITRWNSICEEMFGIKESEAIGKHIWDILELVEDYPGQNRERVDLLFQQGFNREEQILRSSKGEIWGDVFAQAVEANGERLGWVTIIADISERKRMEKELRESEQYMRSLINSLEDLVFTYDLEGHYGPFYKASQDIQNYLDYSKIKFIGAHYKDILPPDVADKLDIAFESVIKTGENTEFDYSVVFGEGILWYNAKVSPIRDASGEFSEILVVSRDITERKRIESELQESEEHMRSLLNSMDDIVFSFDINGIFKNFYQPAFEHNHLAKAKRFIGRNYHEVLPVSISKKLDSAITSLIEDGKHQQFDYCIKPKNELLWYNARISPVTDMSGEVTGITTVSRNITERKYMEEMINRAAKEWETTFNTMFESIYIIDKSYRLVKANKTFCNAVKMNPSDVIGKSCYRIVHGRNNPCPQCVVSEALKTGKPVLSEYDSVTMNKSWQAVTTPIIGNKDEITGFIVTSRDVTEKLKMEEQLKQSQILASLGTMTAGIAHEVNNPLGSVLLISELLLRDNNASHIKKDLKVIHSEAKRAAKIMSTLLTYRNGPASGNRRLNLNRIIKRVLDIRQYRQNVLNIKVTANLPKKPIYVKGDSSQLTQVFINVLMNAEEALMKKGERNIIINVSGDQEWTKISVSDNGTGIPAENLEQVFHPFFTTKKVGEGTGLGLSTCYSIVTSHNGLIHAENNEMGGVTITIELPVTKQNVKKRK